MHASQPVSLLTEIVQHPYRPPEGFEALIPPVHKASTVVFPNVAAMRERQWQDKSSYTYGLHGTPTTFILEERLATLEGGSHTLLCPSGLAAIALVDLALLQPGQRLALPDNAYGPSKEFARGWLRRWGVEAVVYDPLNLESAKSALQQCSLFWVEAPGSVTMEFPDLGGLVGLARQHGVPVALDNTWGAGLAFQPFALGGPAGEEWGVDVSIHALTKYPSGGGDVLMGSVVTRDRRLHERLMHTHMVMGLGVGANDVEAVLRGLPSMVLRYEAQDRAARELAHWLSGQAGVARVLHPALPDAPGHAHWARHCSRAAGLFSVLFDPSFEPAAIDRFVDSLKRFRIGYSWGGAVSLAVPYRLSSMRELPPAWEGHLVRLAIGLEAVEDLKADLEQALHGLNGKGGQG